MLCCKFYQENMDVSALNIDWLVTGFIRQKIIHQDKALFSNIYLKYISHLILNYCVRCVTVHFKRENRDKHKHRTTHRTINKIFINQPLIGKQNHFKVQLLKNYCNHRKYCQDCFKFHIGVVGFNNQFIHDGFNLSNFILYLNNDAPNCTSIQNIKEQSLNICLRMYYEYYITNKFNLAKNTSDSNVSSIYNKYSIMKNFEYQDLIDIKYFWFSRVAESGKYGNVSNSINYYSGSNTQKVTKLIDSANLIENRLQWSEFNCNSNEKCCDAYDTIKFKIDGKQEKKYLQISMVSSDCKGSCNSQDQDTNHEQVLSTQLIQTNNKFVYYPYFCSIHCICKPEWDRAFSGRNNDSDGFAYRIQF